MPPLRAIVRALPVAPPLVGALYVLGLAARSAWASARSLTLPVAAAAVGLGLVIGLAADALLRIRAFAVAEDAAARGVPVRAAASAPTSVRRRVARMLRDVTAALVLVAALHGALVLWSMADAPQLYAERWYARGGGLRLVQILATDVLGPPGVVVAALALGVIFVRPTPLVALLRVASTHVRLHAARVLGPMARRLGVGASVVVAALASTHVLRAPGEARAAPSEAAPRPNILLLVVESLRADRLEPAIAPHLVRLADRGTRFDRAYASIARPFPSWVTLLTGRHPHHHGIRSRLASYEERARDLDALPARLQAAGYATAVVSDHTGEVFRRVELGFMQVEGPRLVAPSLAGEADLAVQTPLLPVLHTALGRRVFPAMRRLATASDPRLVARDVDATLRSLRKGDRPFFLTASFAAAHLPYTAPAPFHVDRTLPSYRGRFAYHVPSSSVDGRPLPAEDADDVRQIRGLYDGAVAAVDDAVGHVLAALDDEGLASRTVVVLTSGHGETLYEHGRGHGHGEHLFGDEGTHVPLVVVDPRLGTVGAKRREPRVVRDVDVAATLYALAGVESPPDLDGRSFAMALGGEPLEPRFAFAESELWASPEVPGLAPDLRIPYPPLAAATEPDPHSPGESILRDDLVALTRMARHRMIRDDRTKLVYVPTRQGPRYFLYDTVTDPGETKDVAAARPDDVARLRTELWRWMLEDGAMETRDGFLVPRQAEGSRAASAGAER